MSEVVDINKGDSLPPLNDGKKNKRSVKRFVSVIVEVLMIGIFAIVFSVASQIIYDFNRYQKFYVNGESMYPTLNKDAKVYDSTGVEKDGKTYLIGDFSTKGNSYLCDYGLMDNKNGYKDDIQRFSIVVAYYNDDMVKNGDSYTPKTGSELKVKRVLALPNEEIYFDNAGDLFIKKEGASSFEKIEQTFFDISSWDDTSKEFLSTVKAHTSVSSRYAYDASHPYVLGDEQYFLVGDNRFEGCSYDSRNAGAINSYALVGRVVTIIGKCWYKISSDGQENVSIDWNKVIMPWNLKLL